MRKQFKYIAAFGISFLLLGVSSVHAAGPPEPSLFSSPMAISLLSLMALLLIIIAVLANVLLGAAQVKLNKDKKQPAVEKAKTAVAAVVLLLFSNSLFAQAGNSVETTTAVSSGIAGMSSTVFYIMMSVIFLELLVILVLLINVRALLRIEKEKIAEATAAVQITRKPSVSWWGKFNRFKPVEQEADIDLGHDYDGIRELDNRLPPWWLYGFYLTIIIAGVYLWRFHVSHTGPSGIEEYEKSVADANAEIKEYLAKKGESVDENTVTLLSAPEDIAEGKSIFLKSCVACHKETGAGDVGPNLTDDYWIHGGDIKSVFKTIRYGINAMPQWQNSYSNKQIAQLASYVKSLKGTNPPNPKAPQGDLYQENNAPAKPAADSAAAKDNKTAMNK